MKPKKIDFVAMNLWVGVIGIILMFACAISVVIFGRGNLVSIVCWIAFCLIGFALIVGNLILSDLYSKQLESGKWKKYIQENLKERFRNCALCGQMMPVERIEFTNQKTGEKIQTCEKCAYEISEEKK